MTAKEIEELAGHRQVPAWVVKLVGDAVAIEREACAKLLEITDLSGLKTDPFLASYTATMLFAYAKAIRARGDALEKLNKAAEDNGEEL